MNTLCTLAAIASLVLTALPSARPAGALTNGNFEESGHDGQAVGWELLAELDEAEYGPAGEHFRFDAVRPVVAAPGRGMTGHALAFPPVGTWPCGVREHDRGRIGAVISPVPGSRRGKAAVCQRVTLPAGRYRFGAFLRTADGDPWSGTFSLGVAINGTTDYADDDSTGIAWSDSTLGMRGDPAGDFTAWGEWQWHATEPFELTRAAPVTVWIRFNYVNRHQTRVRWEVDDAAVVPVPPAHVPVVMVPAGPWDTSAPLHVDSASNFRLELDLTPTASWQRLVIRFRESSDVRAGYTLTVARDGSTVLRSPGAGVIRSQSGTVVQGQWHLGMVVRGQYLRVNLPGETGFETRIIGPRSGSLSVQVEPAGAAGAAVGVSTASSVMPDIPVPVAGEFRRVYDPSAGEDEPWYINDHCVIRDAAGLWHMFGITHAEPFNPSDEDFFAHATAKELMQTPWRKQPYVCSVNAAAGETHVWAPHVVERDGLYYMFYCGGGADGDAYRIDLRTSRDLAHWRWYDGNPLFTDIGNARDPMVLRSDDGSCLMYYTRPADLDTCLSSVAVRQSDDLLHWSPPELALVTQRRERFARRTESPYVFRYDAGEDGAYYLSATGLSGGYRDTRVWRSVNPRRFDADQIVARIDAHAPEWIHTTDGPPTYVTHCGWRQGGLYIAPVRWEHRPWTPFGLLVVRAAAGAPRPIRVEVRRQDTDEGPFRTFDMSEGIASQALPPGRYRVCALQAGGTRTRPRSIEVLADERTEIVVPAIDADPLEVPARAPASRPGE